MSQNNENVLYLLFCRRGNELIYFNYLSRIAAIFAADLKFFPHFNGLF